jgi:putative transposase
LAPLPHPGHQAQPRREVISAAIHHRFITQIRHNDGGRASSPVHCVPCYQSRVERKYEYRRKLPHYQPDFKTFFITFSTHERWILPEDARSLVLQTCLQGNGKNFRLHAGVVMPDHVHLILTPFYDADGPISLMEILQAIKGASAHRINRLLQRRGPVWESESFDRALRREENIDAKIDYLIGNPVGAGLVCNPLDYRWLWRETGEPTM